MYTTFFGLREMPFSITPDPAYLYMSPRHQEALGHLLYGMGQFGGFVQLTGEVGTGKTTVVRTLVEQKLPEVDLAMVLNPRQNEHEFVASICDELHVTYDRSGTLKSLVDALTRHLLSTHAEGRRTVLIIDEAQNLQAEVLEQVRLLTNLETHKEKLLRIMLVGQPELADLLARPDLRQLAQRMTARYHLMPLSADETVEYVRHRLQVAGGPDDLFPPAALRIVHRSTRGIPRLINIVCDRALLGAYGAGVKQVTPALVRKAAGEVGGQIQRPHPRRGWSGAGAWVDAALVVLILVLAAVGLWPQLHGQVSEWVDNRSRPPSAPEASAARRVSENAFITEAALTRPGATSSVRTEAKTGLEHLLPATEPLPTVLARLLRTWNAAPRPQNREPVCTALSRLGLECYRSTGTWDDLRLANRPAILTLRTARGGAQHVLLTGLDDDEALVETAAGPLRIKLEPLEVVWTGEFLLLWRRETTGTYIAPTARGPVVAWLRERLAKANGEPLEIPVSERFDADLRQALIRFQRKRGLNPDGLAGVRTLIALSDVAPAPGTPTLEIR